MNNNDLSLGDFPLAGQVLTGRNGRSFWEYADRKGADIASASALTLGTDGNYFDVTGTTTITSINTVRVGTLVILQFDGALTLTHHATDLVLPTGANITTAAGDHAMFEEYASGDWRCTSYTRASGEALVGSSAGLYRVRVATTTNGTLASAFDDGSTVDGVTLATGDLILVKDQSTATENGVYTVAASGAPTRLADWESSDAVAGYLVVVEGEGTVNANTVWQVANDPGSDVVGTDNLAFQLLGGGGPGLLRRSIYSGSADNGTHTYGSGCVRAKVRGVGAGGGGGGADGQGAGTAAIGEHGGAGGYFEGWVEVEADGITSATITLGDGGAGGAAGANAGSNGSAATVYSDGTNTFTGNVGVGGSGTSGSSGSGGPSTPSAGGTATGGYLNRTGEPSIGWYIVSGDPVIYAKGGNSAIGTGAACPTSNGDGNAGQYGSGGSGGLAWDVSTNYAGGAGGDSWMMIEEYGNEPTVPATITDATTLPVSPSSTTYVGDLINEHNLLINGGGAIWQRQDPTTLTSRSDDTYAGDRWYVLTQTAAIQTQRTTGLGNGPYAHRLKQNQASAQRMGYASIVENKDCQFLRGQSVIFQGKFQISNDQDVRIAIIEWTGTADSVTSDIVNDWTSTTYTAGNFFTSTSTTVTGVKEYASPGTGVVDFEITATLGSSFTNLIVFVWTEGTAAQNVTLDLGELALHPGSVRQEWRPRPIASEMLLCKRYCHVVDNDATATFQIAGFGAVQTTTTAHALVPIPAPMRLVPSLTVTPSDWQIRTSATFDCTDLTILTNSTDEFGVLLLATTGTGMTAADAAELRADGTTIRQMIFDAEL